MNNCSLSNGLTIKTKETFDNIVKVAHRQFSKRGYKNTSIHIIAKKAKLSVGCIYKYFKNKDELYKYIISEEQIKIKDYINLRIKDYSTRFDKEVEGLRAWLFYVRENPNVYKLIWESLFYDKNSFDEYYNNFASSYAKALKHDQEEISNNDYFTDAFMLIGISNFLGVQLMSSKEEYTDEKINQMVDTFASTLKNGLIK